VRALVVDRIYPRLVEVTPEKLPCISYSRVSVRRDKTLTGPVRLVHVRSQLSCWGRTSDEAESVGDAVIKCLHGYRGTMGGIANVGHCFVDNDLDDFESTPELNRRVIDVIMAIEEVA
jgi:hypothetical protein